MKEEGNGENGMEKASERDLCLDRLCCTVVTTPMFQRLQTTQVRFLRALIVPLRSTGSSASVIIRKLG